MSDRQIAAAITELAGRAGGSIGISTSTLVPEGQVYKIGDQIVIGPLTYWSWRHDFKVPMLSMCSRGMRELERDRRKHR